MTDAPKHDFLFTESGDLHRDARHIPAIRKHIDGLPETKATFKPKRIDDVPTGHALSIFLEFVGAWPIADIYDLGGGRKFINPNYCHRHQYSDLVVQCACGAKLSRSYEDGGNTLRDEHEHSNDCKPYQRLRARAEMSERRESYIRRLTALGWTGTDIAPRLGVDRNTMGGICDRLGFTLQERRTVYRRRAGNSYRYAVSELGVDAAKMTNIYGHERGTLNTWVNEYGDYSTPDDKASGRKENGQFGWIQAQT